MPLGEGGIFQPSAAKWNILGTNDASFNDGTGIFGLKKDLLTTDSNPYKFRVRRNGAQNTGNGAFAKINFDTEIFDTNNNFDSSTNYRYTAPVTGFYWFGGGFAVNAAVSNIVAIFVDGSEYRRGDANPTSGAVNVSDIISLNASQYVELHAYGGSATAMDVTNAAVSPYFGGFLVCRT